jgi:hypothetical protein
VETPSVTTLPVRPASPAPPHPIPRAVSAPSRPEGTTAGRQAPPGKAVSEALRPQGSTVSFEVDRRSAGLAVVRLVDRNTGDVVLQMPPEGVLRLVAEVIDQIRGREGTDGRIHR